MYMMNTPHLKRRSRATGFSLLEVLVSILVLSLGMLGAAGMFTKAIENSTDTGRRQMAAMLASEFMETLRADAPRILRSDGTPKSNLGGYATAGQSLQGTCDTASIEPSNRLLCWARRAEKLIPEITAVPGFIEQHFVVAETNGVVSVTVAWPVTEGQCLADDLPPDADYCTYTLRSKL